MGELSIVNVLSGAIIGAIVTAFFGLVIKRRARFVYCVSHSRVGESAEDPVFGSIKVSYNDEPAKNLWLSTLEITNTSLRDFKEVPIQISAITPTILLNQKVSINNEYPISINWDEDYKKLVTPQEGQKATKDQIRLYNSVRKFKFPVVNRGDKLTFTYLTHTLGSMPELHATIDSMGIRCKFRPLTNLPLDFSYTILRAIGFGLVFTIPFLVFVTLEVDDSQYSAVFGWTLGFLNGLLGLWIGRIWDKLRISLFN